MKTYTFNSNIGAISLFEEQDRIVKIQFGFVDQMKGEPSSVILLAKTQILLFLDGKIKEMEFPFSLQGTPFELSVLNTMKRVKYGEKISYKELAIRSGFSKAFRAVKTVCRKNKLPLLFPCHRIIKSDGSTGQYAGGSYVKEQLLLLENNLQL